MILLVHWLSNKKQVHKYALYYGSLGQVSVYYKCFFKNKVTYTELKKNIKKHVFYRKIKHIKYILNNYGFQGHAIL